MDRRKSIKRMGLLGLSLMIPKWLIPKEDINKGVKLAIYVDDKKIGESEALLIESTKFTVDEIAKYYNIPPMYLVE